MFFREQMRAFKLWQKRGGVRGNFARIPGNRRYGDRQGGSYFYLN